MPSPHFMANIKGKSGSSDRSTPPPTALGSNVTVYGDCSHKIKRHLLLGRKTMISLDRLFFKKRERDSLLLTKVVIVKDMFLFLFFQ